MKKKYISIDIGGTELKYARMDETGKILSHSSVPVADSLDGLLDEIETVSSGKENMDGIAISAPGHINARTGYFYTGGALVFLNETDFGRMVEERMHCPVSVINDAKAAAAAEVWKGAMQGVKTGLVLVLGTGIGGAIVLDGKVYRGCSDAAGEVSMIASDWIKPYRKGHVWAVSEAASSLVKRYAAAAGMDPAACNGRLIFARAVEKEETALRVLHEFCADFTSGLFSLQSILDMEKTAVGGGISAQPLLFEIMQEEIDKAYAPFKGKVPFQKPIVVPCRFGNDANLIGALYHFFELYQK